MHSIALQSLPPPPFLPFLSFLHLLSSCLCCIWRTSSPSQGVILISKAPQWGLTGAINLCASPLAYYIGFQFRQCCLRVSHSSLVCNHWHLWLGCFLPIPKNIQILKVCYSLVSWLRHCFHCHNHVSSYHLSSDVILPLPNVSFIPSLYGIERLYWWGWTKTNTLSRHHTSLSLHMHPLLPHAISPLPLFSFHQLLSQPVHQAPAAMHDSHLGSADNLLQKTCCSLCWWARPR